MQGFDFNEIFSLIIKLVTIKLIITLELTRQWYLFQLDVNNAFLNDLRDETLYKSQPPGLQQSNTSQVCKVNKTFYGLKQVVDNGLKDYNLLSFNLVLWQTIVIPLFSSTRLALTLLIS